MPKLQALKEGLEEDTWPLSIVTGREGRSSFRMLGSEPGVLVGTLFSYTFSAFQNLAEGCGGAART